MGGVYERFTKDGSLALLPMSENRLAVVWSLVDERADVIRSLDDSTFLEAVQEHFGQRLGRFRHVGLRHAYPLMLTRARELVRARLALIGNAANTLHPVAAQGFNMGLRDVVVLAQVLVDAARSGRDVGDLQVLRDYADWRRRDHLLVTSFTDALVRVFSNAFAPLVFARNLGLLATDLLPALKKPFIRQGMGLSGRQPRLMRGLAL